jgi:DNA-binding MarR family transcriptional regulator
MGLPASSGNPMPLPAQLEAVREIVLLVNDLGIEVTRAIEDAGLGALSSNVAITVLARLAIDGPIRPRTLLRATKLTRGGLSNLLDRLEADQLITRRYGTVPGDRRGALISATDAGKDAADTITLVMTRTLEQMASTIDELVDLLDAAVPPAPSTPTTSTAIGGVELLGRMGVALTDAFAMADREDPTPGKTAVLLCSAVQPGGTRPKELIERTGLSSGGVTQLLDRVEATGLIHRRSGSPPDRRAIMVELTPQGHHQLVHGLMRAGEQLGIIRAAFDNISSIPHQRRP